MTTYDDPPTHLDDLEDHTDPAPPRHNGHHPDTRAPQHDTAAEEAALGAMLYSVECCDTILELGLDPGDFYTPRNATIFQAICATLTDGEIPDPVTVHARITDPQIAGHELVALVGATRPANAWSYARRILTCSHARTLQGQALEVAEAARTGQLDEAIRLIDQLGNRLPVDDTTSTWTPIDITAIVNGDTTGPQPTILAVTDSVPLFYAGRTNALFGESGGGKTWVALAAIVEAIAGGHDAALIDLEDTATGIVARLLLLGLTRQQVADHFIYIQPDTAWTPTAQAQIAQLLTTRNPTVVVIDSTGEAMAIDGVKGNDDDDVARWFTTFPKFIARLGPAVILTDHIPKATDAPQLYQIGSQRKRAAIDGASYRIDAVKEPSRTSDGIFTATCAKDRHGHHTKGQKAAQILLSHDHAGDAVTLAVQAPEAPPRDADGNFRPTVLMEKVSRLLEDGESRSGNQIEKSIRGKAAAIREATRLLIVEGYIEQDPTARGFAYRSLGPFREADDHTPEGTHEEESDAV